MNPDEVLDDSVGHAPAHVAVMDDDRPSVLVIQRLLEHHGYRVSPYTQATELLAQLAEYQPDAICLDLHVPGYEGTELLGAVRRLLPQVPVVMLTADDNPSSVVAAMRAGAFDYVTKPVDRDRLLMILTHGVSQARLARRLMSLEHPIGNRRFGQVFGRSSRMLDLFRQLDGATGRDVPVLLEGEVGTGKALLARSLHARSPRSRYPFVELNLATAPEPTQAGALFGFSRSASRESSAARRGLLDQASGGTLLLRDVGELGPIAQAGLLRLLERGSFLRVGGGAEVPCDVRIVATSSCDLTPHLADGRFREALYFRLAVFDVRVPPLRERQDDIVPLATDFLRDFSSDSGRPVPPSLSPDAAAALLAYRWPGNVRELSNAVQRALLASRGETVSALDLPSYLRGDRPPANAGGGWSATSGLPVETLESLERRAILAAMGRHGGNAAAASRELGIGRATLYRKLKKYGSVALRS